MALNNFYWKGNDLDPMAALQQLLLLKALALNKRDAAQIVLNRTGGGEILAWHWLEATWPPSWAMFKQEGTGCLVFNGTTNLPQIAGHLWGATGTPLIGEIDIFTHSVHYKVWQELFNQIRDAIPPEGFDRFLISGHSYGGALAHLTAIATHEGHSLADTATTQLLTFGQPRTFTSGLRTHPFKYFRVVNGNDPVPILPPVRTALVLGLGKLKFTKFMTHNALWLGYGDPWRTAGGTVFTRNSTDGNSTLDDLHNWSTQFFPDHFLDNYMISTQGWLRASKQNSWNYDLVLDTLGYELRNDKPIQNPDVVLPQATYIVAKVANDVYQSTAGSLWTQENLQFTQALVAGVTDVTTRTGANKGERRRTMASGYWRCTAFIGNSKNGDSQSVVLNRPLVGSDTIQTIVQLGMNWAHQRALLFGFNGAAGLTVRKDQGCPAITYLRVSDALNPRITKLTSLPLFGFTGFAVADNTAADRLSTSVSFRMYGQRADGLNEFANHCIVGQPDTVCKAGVYDGANVNLTSVQTWDGQFRAYITWLTNQANGLWGFMGQSAAQPNRAATGATLNAQGLWQVSVDTTGWAKGDTVLITRANAAGFNGQSKIDIVSPTALVLLTKRIPTDIPAFTFANVRRVTIYGQAKPLQFFQYLLPPAGLTAPMDVFIAKKNLGKEFDPATFTKRRKKKVA